jgi:dolichyl-phosphate-mannose--protein O-mannosyl transferase
MSYLPFFLVPRTLFLYHYIIPLIFGCACFGIALDFWMSDFWKAFVMVLVAALVIFGFSEWAPLVYAKKMSDGEYRSRMWNQAWMNGRKGRQEWIARYDERFRMYEEQHLKYEAWMKKLNRTI